MMLENNTAIPNPLGFEVVTRKSKKLLNLILKISFLKCASPLSMC